MASILESMQSVQFRPFGTLPTGESVELWTLQGSGGLIIEVMSYGGIVTRVLAPDCRGRVEDVVLGFNRLEDYLSRHLYFGAIAGRVAGRITGAAFELDGQRIQLRANESPNHLHNGDQGFDRKLWKATPLPRNDGAPSLLLRASSAAGEEGYPGAVEVCVIYTVTHDNTFLIETQAVANCATPFNLTHHSYYNLAVESSGSVQQHTLQVHADEYVPIDPRMTLLERLEPVTATGHDLRQPRLLGDAIPEFFQQHGAFFKTRQTPCHKLTPVARLVDPASGRVLTVSTNESYLQVYTGAALDGSLRGKSGVIYNAYAGICLECQGYADGMNAPQLGDIILRPGEPQHRITAYAFSVTRQPGNGLDESL